MDESYGNYADDEYYDNHDCDDDTDDDTDDDDHKKDSYTAAGAAPDAGAAPTHTRPDQMRTGIFTSFLCIFFWAVLSGKSTLLGVQSVNSLALWGV